MRRKRFTIPAGSQRALPSHIRQLCFSQFSLSAGAYPSCATTGSPFPGARSSYSSRFRHWRGNLAELVRSAFIPRTTFLPLRTLCSRSLWEHALGSCFTSLSLAACAFMARGPLRDSNRTIPGPRSAWPFSPSSILGYTSSW